MRLRRASFRRLAALAVIVANCGFVVACRGQLYLRDGARARLEYRLVNPSDRRSPRDYFFRLEGQREDGTAIAIAPFLVAPGAFWFEGIGGISDLARLAASSDSFACFELFEEEFYGDLDHSVALCGRYVSGGYQVFSSENQDQRFYAGVYLLEFRIEFDGTHLTFSTRPVGASTWDLVTTVPFSYDTRLVPSVGGLGFHRKGTYDLLELDWSTTPPVDPTAEETFGWHVQEAYRYDLAALDKLEGAMPDFPGATADFGLARSRLSLALAAAPDFIDAKIGKQAVRYAIRADKRLEKAQREASDQDANGSIAHLLRSLREQATAFQVTFALDYRDEF